MWFDPTLKSVQGQPTTFTVRSSLFNYFQQFELRLRDRFLRQRRLAKA
jgi:hypothetical protein